MAPTNFTRKLALQRLAVVVLLIRSTTGITTPSLVCTRNVMNLSRMESPRRGGRNKSNHGNGRRTAAGGGRRKGRRPKRRGRGGIKLAVGPQQLRLRNHIFVLAHRIMVKCLETSPHDPLGITDSACKNQLVMVSVQYGPFNTYIPIRSTTIGKSRVARDPITMHTSRRSNSDIACVTRCRVDVGVEVEGIFRKSQKVRPKVISVVFPAVDCSCERYGTRYGEVSAYESSVSNGDESSCNDQNFLNGI
ncbi:hypothetical protein F511_30776 [Dorcoceras hygrometricum]|uniref:Uncharacterized protein n=1 Tax=Dorcoceras hygrometricum TaxID=472368 RepID=A0A2Z7AQN8_9LAMI|nr:hypothetical protein F511_30776 [Dorcoceras hygrometricum]